MAKVTIRVTTGLARVGDPIPAGSVITVDTKEATRLVEAGFAEYVDEKPVKAPQAQTRESKAPAKATRRRRTKKK